MIVAKTYIGRRAAGAGEVSVVVQTETDTQALRLYGVHSPSGFEWGYGGSGPSELAYCILADLMGLRYAQMQHMQFKWDVTAKLPHDAWRLTEAEVRAWVAEHPEDEHYLSVAEWEASEGNGSPGPPDRSR